MKSQLEVNDSVINIKEAFKKNNPSLYVKLPKFIFKLISILIKEKEINAAFLDSNNKGVSFVKSFLSYLNIKIIIKNSKKLDKNKKYIFVSNHPLGAIDGLALLCALFDEGFSTKIVVNDLLNQITPMRDVIIPLNLYGKLNKSQSLVLNKTLLSEQHVLIFPAGQVSKIRGFKIEDADWTSFFIRKVKESKREVVPLYFEGRNSLFFYLIAYLRKSLRLKINLEMLLLPRQIFFARGKQFNIHCGDPIPLEEFEKEEKNHQSSSVGTKKHREINHHLANWVRDKVYRLKDK